MSGILTYVHGRLSGHTGNVWPMFTERDFSCVQEMNKWTYYRGMACIHGEGHLIYWGGQDCVHLKVL